jgi:hypothetical protein
MNIMVSSAIRTFLFVTIRISLKRSQNGEAQGETVEHEKLSSAADAMQSVVESFKGLTRHERPSDIKSAMSAASKYVSNPVYSILS